METQLIALQVAAEVLTSVINQTKERLKETQSQAEKFQETIFVVYDTAEKKHTLISDIHNGIYMDLTPSLLGREYLYSKQTRYENQALQLQQKLDDIQQELNQILSILKNNSKNIN